MRTFNACSIGAISALLCCAALIAACSRSAESECDISALMLDENEVPEGWTSDMGAGFLPAQDALGAQKAYHIFMQNDSCTAHYTVYQYSNAPLANLHVWLDDAVFFPSGRTWSDLDLGKISRADRQRMRCGDRDNSKRCVAVLVYGPYLARLSSAIRDHVLDLHDFENLVVKIDEKFERCASQR